MISAARGSTKLSQRLSGVVRKPGCENLAAVVPENVVRESIQRSSSRVYTENLGFRSFFGVSGVFVAVALVAQASLAVVLGFRAEKANTPAVQVVCMLAIAVYATIHLFNTVVHWRTLVLSLKDIIEGQVDPLEALNKFPAVKRLMKWYHDNFAVHTGGKYSLLLVIGAEVFELMVQAANANSMAGYLDWPALSFYGTLISTNFIMFGICMLSDERFVSQSVIITIDVIMGEPRASDASAKKSWFQGSCARATEGSREDLRLERAQKKTTLLRRKRASGRAVGG